MLLIGLAPAADADRRRRGAGSLPRSQAGIGSGNYGVAIQIGGALGVAVIGSLLSSRYQHHITAALAHQTVPPAALHAITGSLGGALGVASTVGGVRGAMLAHAARSAFMSGGQLALGVGAIVALAASLLVLAALPSRAPGAGRVQKRSGTNV